jgi:hypothetical protein
MRMVARLGELGHRRAWPSSRVLGAIIMGRRRGIFGIGNSGAQQRNGAKT